MLVILLLLVLVMIYYLVMLVKVKVTGRNLNLLLNAVYDYNVDCVERGCYNDCHLEYFDIFPDFDAVLYRLFDWGYENILPKEAMEKIRPFIKE